MIKKKPKEKLLIGRSERIDLPELKLKSLEAKVDTGAYTSSLHCHNISVVRKNGTKYLQFYLLDPSHPKYGTKVFKSKNFQQKRVKSSNGKSEVRYIIKTLVRIYDKDIETEFSLSDRSEMKYPVLLGRKFIKQGYVVDVTKVNLAEIYKKKAKKPIMIMLVTEKLK